MCAHTQGLICVGTVGNAAPILFLGGNAVPTLIHIFLWERSSYSVPSLYPLGLHSSLNRQQSCHWWMCSYICKPCCVSSWARSLRQIVIVIAPTFSPSPPSSPFRFPSPFSFPFRGPRPSRETQLAGLGERWELPQRVRAESGRKTHFGAF